MRRSTLQSCMGSRLLACLALTTIAALPASRAEAQTAGEPRSEANVDRVEALAAAGNLRFEITGEMTRELRLALARVVSPEAFKDVPDFGGPITLDEFCARFDCTPTTRGVLEGVGQGSLPSSLENRIEGYADLLKERERADFLLGTTVVPNVALSVDSNPATGAQSFALVPPNSPLASALGRPGSDKVTVLPVPETAIGDSTRAPLTAYLGPDGGNGSEPALGAIWLNEASFRFMAEIEDEISARGSAYVALPLANSVAPDDIADLLSAVDAVNEGETRRVTIEPTLSPSIIQLDLPASVEIQSAEATNCDKRHADWPFNVAEIADVISYNDQVLEAFGPYTPKRAHVLVVDTGIASRLAASKTFERFLYADLRDLLGPAEYYASGSEINKPPSCLYPNSSAYGTGYRSTTAFGHISPEPELQNCSFADPLDLLEPPRPTRKVHGELSFYSGHGGFVGALAAGGPELTKRVLGLERYVGIGFSRIFNLKPIPNKPTESYAAASLQDVESAMIYAVRRDVDVLNASLLVPHNADIGGIDAALRGFKGVVVAAAGNAGREIGSENTESGSVEFPASMAGKGGDIALIVVAALAPRKPGETPELWQESSFSDAVVDIAAPGEDLPSYDENGDIVCSSGTSAAAPLVSFTAAMLTAFGLPSAEHVRRRILATAEIEPALDGVKEHRILDIAQALDVFVDLIWLEGEKTPIRAVLLPPPGQLTGAAMLPVCQATGAGTSGTRWYDARQLVSWRRVGAGQAELSIINSTGISREGRRCPTGNGTIAYHDLTTGRDVFDRTLSEIDRIVPTRLRKAITAAINVEAANR